MKNMQNSSQDGNSRDDSYQEEGAEVEIEMEGDSYVEQLLKAAIKGYEHNHNKFNDKWEIKFVLTITTHKVARPEGNKDVAYLRLDRHFRAKGSNEDYVPQLVAQEGYIFRDLKERVNPAAPWKEQLYLNCLARLVAGGLEYGELMRRMKNVQEAEKKTEEQRLAAMNLVKADAVPAPLTEEDKAYADWVKKEKGREGQ